MKSFVHFLYHHCKQICTGWLSMTIKQKVNSDSIKPEVTKNHGILWKRERQSVYRETRAEFNIAWLCLRSTLQHGPLSVKPLHKDQYLFSINIQNKSLFTGCLLSCLEDLHWQQNGALGGLHKEGDQWGKGLRSTDLLLLWVD